MKGNHEIILLYFLSQTIMNVVEIVTSAVGAFCTFRDGHPSGKWAPNLLVGKHLAQMMYLPVLSHTLVFQIRMFV